MVVRKILHLVGVGVICQLMHNPAIFINLNVIECVMGCICVWTLSKCWGIINCSGDYKWTVFAEDVLLEEELERRYVTLTILGIYKVDLVGFPVDHTVIAAQFC